jgi:hypothetical protein
MLQNTSPRNLCLLTLLALCLAAAVLAQDQPARMRAAGQRGASDQLLPLKNALAAASATALSTTQETKINTLLTNFRTATGPTATNAEVPAARVKYNDAILAGDTKTASAQIPSLVEIQTRQANEKMMAEAAFCIGVVQNLTADQVSALQKQLGSAGFVRTLETITNGMVGSGRGMGSPGRGPIKK